MDEREGYVQNYISTILQMWEKQIKQWLCNGSICFIIAQ